jgi:hypothetical protein
MATYVVKDISLRHNGKRYQPGDKVELNDAEAERLSAYVAPYPGTPVPGATEQGDAEPGDAGRKQKAER